MTNGPAAPTASDPVVIIGAGISGLTTGFFLRQRNIPVHILERDAEPGGTMKTEQEQGWLIETGPNSTLETTPLFRQLFRDLKIEDQVAYANPAGKIRYIVRGGRLHPLPMGPAAFLRTGLWTTSGKLRLLQEPFIGRGEGEESIAQFVERRLGREFLDYAINPFVAGVYAGDPRALSVQAAFPKLYALEEKYGGLIKGVIGGRRERKRRAEKAKDRAEMFSFRQGMQTLPRAFAAALGDDLHLSVTIDRLSFDTARRRWSVHYTRGGQAFAVQASAVVLSVPAYAAAEMVRPFSAAVASRLNAIVYPPVAEVFSGYTRSQVGIPLNGFGYLVPEVEQRKILGTIWSSSLFPGRTPSDDFVALTTFVGGARQPALAREGEQAILRNVSDELAALMHISGAPVFARVRTWDRAIPQYNLGYGAILKSIDAFEAEQPGLFFCSNYRGGIAVGDCVMSAEKMSKKVADHLFRSSP